LLVCWHQRGLKRYDAYDYYIGIRIRIRYADSEAADVSFCCNTSATTEKFRYVGGEGTFRVGRFCINYLFQVYHVLIEKLDLLAIKLDRVIT
jgi:hypothetical protein